MFNSLSRVIPVALCVDRNVLPGLHVTLLTTLIHLDDRASLDIHLFCHELTSDQRDALRRTLDSTNRSYALTAYPMDASMLASVFPASGVARSGAWMAYGRLMISRLIERPRFVYLDSDLIVSADVAELFEMACDHELAAVTWQDRKDSIDASFFRAEGLPIDLPYFNSGVLVIDRDRWISADTTSRALEVSGRYGSRMPSADQTILNVLFGASFMPLDRRFNTPVSANRAPLSDADTKNRVIHLLGRPKPWDPLGRYLNGQSKHFQLVYQKTAFHRHSRGAWSVSGGLGEVSKHLNAYGKCVIARLIG